MKTYSPKPEHIERRWYVLDAGEQVLGRVASEAAVILRGKHKPIFAPHMDVGDNLIIINAAKVVLTGGKETKKIAWRHSGHPGGITGTLYEDLLAKRPAFVVEKAVRGMLPKNRLGRAMIKKLHVVPGPEHPHQAQQPEDWTIGMRPAWDGLPAPRVPVANGKTSEVAKEQAVEAPSAAEQAEKPTVAKTTARSARSKTTAKKPTAAKTTAAKKPTAKKPAAARKPTTRKPPPSQRSDGEEEGDVVATTQAKLITGRRKAAIARVRLVPGSGEFRINERSLDEYFPTRVHRMVAQAPLRSVGRDKDLDVVATITGGGVNGQAGALRLGIARALLDLDPELRAQLKAEGFLRRDAREKERRKYGLKKARKAPQYSKR